MKDRYDDYEVGETLAVVSIWTVGVGILVMALFPFAIPIIALTLVFAAPLVLLALPVALLAAAWVGGRAVVRRVRAGRERRGTRVRQNLPTRPAGVTNRAQGST
jgi:hypothetical protein